MGLMGRLRRTGTSGENVTVDESSRVESQHHNMT